MNLPIKQLDSVLKQEVSRQEFLKILAIGLLSVVGVWSVLGNLQNATSPIPELGKRASTYSTSTYSH